MHCPSHCLSPCPSTLPFVPCRRGRGGWIPGRAGRLLTTGRRGLPALAMLRGHGCSRSVKTCPATWRTRRRCAVRDVSSPRAAPGGVAPGLAMMGHARHHEGVRSEREGISDSPPGGGGQPRPVLEAASTPEALRYERIRNRASPETDGRALRRGHYRAGTLPARLKPGGPGGTAPVFGASVAD